MDLPTFYSNLIDRYREEEQNSLHSQVGQLSYYKKLKLEEAIEDAVFGRYLINGHQYFSSHFKYFPQSVTAQPTARDRLLKKTNNIRTARDFISLYNVVRESTENIKGLSLLFYYDTALRIGAANDIGLSPDHVFLQRGAQLGADATLLGIKKPNNDAPFVEKRLFYPLSDRFRDMEAQHIEAFLCIFHKEIQSFMKVGLSKRS